MAHKSAGRSALARVLAVLETFDQDNSALTVSRISQRSGLPVPTVYRIVAELLEMGLLERGSDRRLHVGVRLWEIASRAPRALGLREAAMPFMEDLHAATRQHTQLYVLEGCDALVIERLSTRSAVTNVTQVGDRQPLHATTGGLVLLAHASLHIQDSFLSAPMRAYTPNTPTDPAELRRILANIRTRGYVVCDGYITPDALGVGTPVYSPSGDVIAALSVVVPRDGAQPMTHVRALRLSSRGITDALVKPQVRHGPQNIRLLPFTNNEQL